MKTRIGRYWPVAFGLLLLACTLTPAYAEGPQAKSLGLENPGKIMNVHVMLNLRNPEGLKALREQLRANNTFPRHQFLSRDEFAAQLHPAPRIARKWRTI